MFVFNSGQLIGTPRGGSPINFGMAQEVTLNISTTTKALYGQYNFPVAIGSGTKKMTGKAKSVKIAGQVFGLLFSAAASEITFSANLFASDPSTGKEFSVLLYNCVAKKSSFILDLVPELDFQVFANSAGQVCQFNFGD